MDNNQTLPPLPPSDPGSLTRGHFDQFYKVSSRSFWKDNQVTYNKVEDMKKCEHNFKQSATDFICTLCGFGLMGGIGLSVQDGKLFYKNEKIVF